MKCHIFEENEPNPITTQTVFDSDGMKLHHTRIANKSELPRRIATQRQQTSGSGVPTADSLREYLLAQADSKVEVDESKQILFDKHMGDERTILSKQDRAIGNRPRFGHFRRGQSDDGMSSNYPNSSRSTVRDLTCSSMSSNLAASNSIITETDVTEPSEETEINFPSFGRTQSKPNVVHNNSIEYKNRDAEDHKRFIENRWGIQGSTSTTGRKYFDESDPIYEFNQLVRSMETPKSVRKAMTPLGDSSSHIGPVVNEGVSIDMHRLEYDLYHRPRRNLIDQPKSLDPQRSSLFPAQIAGYTREHLMRARKFGDVIEAIRKPGHHVGPAKNPDCHCEHCKRWFAERENYRMRASSMSNISLSRASFWLTRREPGNR